MAKRKSSAPKAKKIGGPFLAAAVFCESIMEDANSKKLSVSGIMDSCNFWISNKAPADFPSETSPATVLQNILITFRTGDCPGKHKLKLVVEHPNGMRKEAIVKDIDLSKPQHGGCNVRTQATFQVHISGVYLIDVYLDGKRFTRMPLNIAFGRLPSTPT